MEIEEKKALFIKLLYYTQLNLTQITKGLGVSRSTASKWKNELCPGLDYGKIKRMQFDEIYKPQTSVNKLAKTLNMHPGSIRRFIREHKKTKSLIE